MLNVANPASPSYVGGYTTSAKSGRGVLALAGDNLYVAESTAGVELVQINLATGALLPMGHLMLAGSVEQVAASPDGNNVYAATDNAGLYLLQSVSRSMTFFPFVTR